MDHKKAFLISVTLVLCAFHAGCASIRSDEDSSSTTVAHKKVTPGYISGSPQDIPIKLHPVKLFRSSKGSSQTGPEVYDPDYAEYVEWKRWQEFKAYMEWKAEKQLEKQGS